MLQRLEDGPAGTDLQLVDEMPFPALQSLFDPLIPKRLQWYWKGYFVTSLRDEAIETHIAQAAQAPSELSLMHLYPIDSAVRGVGHGATAWNARNATCSKVIAGDDRSGQGPEGQEMGDKAIGKAVHPFNAEGAYVNFLMDDEGKARIRASYGENYERLAAVKAKYDPANLFRVNQNIRPAA